MDTPRTRRQAIRQVVKTVELRLRFVALLAITGLTFAYWDTIANRFDKWMRPTSGHVADSGLEFFCPMHPQVVQHEPGQCPICGMPLAKRAHGERPPLPDGATARVALDPSRVIQAGIRTVAVGYEPLARTLTTVGEIGFDERRLATIPSKVPGTSRVERLFADFTGKDVAAGEPLAELYSPELAQAMQEVLIASRSRSSDRADLVRLSAEKLRRWGITPAQIDELLKQGRADATVPILAPIGGTLVKKNVVQGQQVAEGFPLFEVADLSRVWIRAQVYEHQLGLVHVGQTVEATVPSYPGEVFPGIVQFLQPTLDAATRTVEVRFDVTNPSGRLRPGMFATVTLQSPAADAPEFRARVARHDQAMPKAQTVAQQKKCPVTKLKLGAMGDPVAAEIDGHRLWTCCGSCLPKLKAEPAKYLAQLESPPPPDDHVLSIPESAVIDTGRRQVVYVETEPGVFEGRVVVLGPRVGDRFPVLDGLDPGDRVAAAGAFLIDAESRLNPTGP